MSNKVTLSDFCCIPYKKKLSAFVVIVRVESFQGVSVSKCILELQIWVVAPMPLFPFFFFCLLEPLTLDIPWYKNQGV